ncbi:benzoate/H(+) symporter BenE family transporter [Pseudomonas sp. Marseille-QA0892]
MPFSRELSLSAVVAGFVATVISYAGPLIIIFQVARAAELPTEILSSWVWAISMGSGVLGIVLSLRYRVPVVIAWSAPGSALLVALLPQVGLAQAVGAYIVANIIVLAIGLSGAFDRIVQRLPASICAAMLAGILFDFGSGLFLSMQDRPQLVAGMCVAYLITKRYWPRYAVFVVLATGVGLSYAAGDMQMGGLEMRFAVPVWITPEFTWSATLNIALPLAVVALTGQFVPGMALLRSCGYHGAPARPILSSCGLFSILLAPFGCHGLALGALTAAICTAPEAHDNPAKRYVAAVSGGVCYLLFGLFGATLVALFTSFPAELVAALAGLALFGAITASLSASMAEPDQREAALVTVLTAASGMTLLGLSSAFWGLIFGLGTHLLLSRGRTAPASPQAAPPPVEASKH